MYVPAPFKVHPAIAFAFAATRGFGTAIAARMVALRPHLLYSQQEVEKV
jgi:hypothetical protein